MQRWAGAAFALGAASLLGHAAWQKLRNRWAFAAAMRTWGLRSRRTVVIGSRALPLLEAAATASLVLSVVAPCLTVVGRIPGVILGCAFLTGQLWLAWRHPGAKCGCTARPSRVSARSALRPASLLALSGAGLLLGRSAREGLR